MLPESWDRWIVAIPQIPNRKLGKYRRHNFEYFRGRALSGLGLTDTCGAAEVREVCARYQIKLGKLDFRCGAAWRLISTFVVTAVKLAKSRVGLPTREEQRLRDAEAIRKVQLNRSFHQHRGLSPDIQAIECVISYGSTRIVETPLKFSSAPMMPAGKRTATGYIDRPHAQLYDLETG